MSLLKAIPKMALGSASVLAAVYVGFSPRIAQNFYNSMIFRPYPYPEGDYKSGHIGGQRYEDVWFDSADGTRLHGWYFRQEGSAKTILLSHGNTGNLSGRPVLLEQLLNTGYSLLVYDYRGYGKSEGKPTVRGVIEDGCAAFDYLVKRKGINPESIILYGESLGAAVTCQIVKQRNPAGFILQSGFASLPKIGRQHVPLMSLYPGFLFPQPLMDSMAVLQSAHPPVLILHGMKDVVVPFSHGEALSLAAVGKKTFIPFPEAEHSNIPVIASTQFVAAIKDFVGELGAI
ncbi:MAG: alpha/beta hydrolase [Candidatus Obscuribacterales bacterium]|nr:alpha/beta hydrolase [Candidatus Obscuribacterales bacterium]